MIWCQDLDIHQLIWFWYSSIDMILIFINWHDSDIHQLTWFWYSSIDMILIFINWHDSAIHQLTWFCYSSIDMILIFTNQCPWNKYSPQELLFHVIYFSIYIHLVPYIGILISSWFCEKIFVYFHESCNYYCFWFQKK